MADVADYFEVLGLPRRAVLDEEDVRSAFRECGKVTHPDAGGDETAFELVNRAYAALRDPGERLRHLSLLEFGAAPDPAGTIDAETMALFEKVGGALARADAYFAKRDAASSAIAKALLASEEVAVQRDVMLAGGAVRGAREALLGRFEEIDRNVLEDRSRAELVAGECFRALGFLSKWEAQISERMVGLI
jgi:curved DNA-binding protein CbpA